VEGRVVGATEVGTAVAERVVGTAVVGTEEAVEG
jgi:hypothetical protein